MSHGLYDAESCLKLTCFGSIFGTNYAPNNILTIELWLRTNQAMLKSPGFLVQIARLFAFLQIEGTYNI